MSFDEVSRFDWVRDSAIGEAGCITLVTPADLTAVAAAFGGDLSQGREGRLADGLSGPDTPTALVRHVGDWILVVENNGFEGSRPEVLRRAPGRAVSLFWNVNAATQFSLAKDGTILMAFEALFPDYATGARPDALAAYLSGLPWHDPSVDSVSLMLALAARVTGVALQPEHLAGPMMLVPLVPWLEGKPQRVSPRHEPLTYADPAVSYALQHTDEAHLWAVARAAVRGAAEVAGLGDDPRLLAVIDGSAGTAERAALDEMAHELEAAQRWSSFRAVGAARYACGPNALAAAFRAITEADHGVRAAGADPTTLRNLVMAVLDNPPAPAGSGSATATDGFRPWDRYTWINDHWLGWAAQATFIRGLSATHTAAGNESSGPAGLEPGVIFSVQVSGWTVLLEVGEVARPLLPYLTTASADGEAVHVNWSARGQAHFWHVVDGDLRSTFNVFQPDYIHGSTPHELGDLSDGLVFPLAGLDGGRQAPMLLALAERVTGIVLTPELLDQNWTTVTSVPERQAAPRLERREPPGQPAEEFTDPRLVALYDSWEPDRPDHTFYRDFAAMLPAQTIVDIGCGTGRLAVELARQGHRVTGIDPSPAMLAAARGREGADLVRWIEGDASALGNSEYDLAVMSGSVVQSITDNRALTATFAAIRRALRPGGRLAFDSRNPFARVWTQWTPERSRRQLTDAVEAWFQNSRLDGDLVTFQTHFRFASGEELVSHNHLRFWSYGWLRRMLIDADFRVDPVDFEAPELIFLATASSRQPVAVQVNRDDHGDLVTAILYDTGETVTVPVGDADTPVALQRMKNLDVPTDVALHAIEQFDPGFDIRDEIHRRSEADMAEWRKADQERREQLKREFRRQRETQEHAPDTDS